MTYSRPVHSGFSRPIHLVIGRSRRLHLLLAVMHAGAAGTAVALALPWWLRLLLLTAVAASGWHAYRRYMCKGGAAVSELLLRADGVFEVTTATGIEEATLETADLVEPWLTVFTLRSGARSRLCVILLPDNVAAEPYRRLRVRLRELEPIPGGAIGAAEGARGGGS